MEVSISLCQSHTPQLLFRFAAAYEHRALGIASHWPFERWGRFLPEHITAISFLDRLLHHATVVVTEGESLRVREAVLEHQRVDHDLAWPEVGWWLTSRISFGANFARFNTLTH